MDVKQNFSLRPYNTFGLDVKASSFVEVTSKDELVEALKNAPEQFMILGGGSNVLFTADYDGLVIKNSIKGLNTYSENAEEVVIESGAGEVWHELVLHTIENGWGGIENLSLIPGTVGAAPMQNIGAYGVEIKDVFHSLKAIHVDTHEEKMFTAEDCRFGYRESVFKKELKNKYVITHVRFTLSKDNHELNTSYGAIQDTLHEKGIDQPTIADVSAAVIAIRQSKLPNPAEIGNAGSFFKNPTISSADYKKLKQIHENMPGYVVSDSETKVPAGWLIERCGWKGHVENSIGVHKNQALVLVNYGGGKGEELKELAFKIQHSVKEKFGIELTPEVNFV